MFPLALPYKLLAIAVVGIAIFATGYVKGAQHSTNKYLPEIAAMQAKAEAQNLQTAQTILQQKQATLEVQSEYEDRLNRLATYYNGLLHDPNGSSKVPTIPNTTGGADASSPYITLANACAITTNQLVELQNWIKKQEALNGTAN